MIIHLLPIVSFDGENLDLPAEAEGFDGTLTAVCSHVDQKPEAATRLLMVGGDRRFVLLCADCVEGFQKRHSTAFAVN